MAAFPILNDGQIESVSRILGDCGTGADITRILSTLGLEDKSGESTKWKRIYCIFQNSQQVFKSSNHVFAFVKAFLSPTRFVSQELVFEKCREELNKILSFSGLTYGEDGEFRMCAKTATISEAVKRVQLIKHKLAYRNIHSEVYNYCRAELMQDNYFHAVFEATKGLAQRIRELSGLTIDGSELIDKAFSVNNRILAINTLQTETEQSEQKGFAQLLKGCFMAIRNPLAHEPKILWNGEEDAADYLTLISLLHRKLDKCIKVSI